MIDKQTANRCKEHGNHLEEATSPTDPGKRYVFKER